MQVDSTKRTAGTSALASQPYPDRCHPERNHLAMKTALAVTFLLFVVGCSDDVSESGLATPDGDVSIVLVEAYPDLPAFDEPVAMAYDIEGERWYVAERSGRVLWFRDDPEVSDDPRLALDISREVQSTPPEAGLLGLALHPEFAVNRELFLSFTREPVIGDRLFSQISRFFSSNQGRTFERLSEEQILTVIQDFDNHNGGNIAFDADGLLYAGFGDGGDSGDPDELDDPNERAQDTTNLLGTIIRIDIDGNAPYEIPEGNPFSNQPPCVQGFGSADCPEIFAWGFRNPWRWSFDARVGNLWAGDVGEDRFEEIDRVEVGLNYGWPIREGANCNRPETDCRTRGLEDPVFEYGRALGQSVTGGIVYRGTDVEDLEGVYLFGDFLSGRLWGLFQDTDEDFSAQVLIDNTGLAIVSFAEDADNELYLLDYSGGRIYKVEAGN